MKYSILSACLLSCFAANAEVDINGFSTIGLTKSSGDNQVVDHVDFKNQSLFGLQATNKLNDNLSGTVQVVSRGADNFELDVEWAYLSYQLDNNNIKVGRQRLPLYRYTDFADVGYAFDFAALPQSVYALRDFDIFEGISLTRTNEYFGFTTLFQAFYGNSNDKAPIYGVEVPFKSEGTKGFNITIDKYDASLRLAYITTSSTFDFNVLPAYQGLTSALAAYGLQSSITDLSVDEDKTTFKSVGFDYSFKDWKLMTEYTNLKVDNSFLADDSAYYVSVLKRINEVSVMATYEREKETAQTSWKAIPRELGNVPVVVPVDGQAVHLQDVVAGFYGVDKEFKTLSLGMRYDITSNTNIKASAARKTGLDNDYTETTYLLNVNTVF